MIKQERTEYLFTKGKEFTLDSEEYIGQFNLKNGIPFTGQVFVRTLSRKLEIFSDDKNINEYNKSTNDIIKRELDNFRSPKLFIPQPTDNDYRVGFITRYFVKKRNGGQSTIEEIDKEQFDSLETGSRSGINQDLYFGTSLRWKITGKTKEEVSEVNKSTLKIKEKNMLGLSNVIGNLTEFLKFF